MASPISSPTHRSAERLSPLPDQDIAAALKLDTSAEGKRPHVTFGGATTTSIETRAERAKMEGQGSDDESTAGTRKAREVSTLTTAEIGETETTEASFCNTWCACLNPVWDAIAPYWAPVKPYWDKSVEFCAPYCAQISQWISDGAVFLWNLACDGVSYLWNLALGPKKDEGKEVDEKKPAGDPAVDTAKSVVDAKANLVENYSRLQQEQADRAKSAAAPEVTQPASEPAQPKARKETYPTLSAASPEELNKVRYFQRTYGSAAQPDGDQLVADLAELLCKEAVYEAVGEARKLTNTEAIIAYIRSNPTDATLRAAIAKEDMEASVAISRQKQKALTDELKARNNQAAPAKAVAAQPKAAEAAVEAPLDASREIADSSPVPINGHGELVEKPDEKAVEAAL